MRRIKIVIGAVVAVVVLIVVVVAVSSTRYQTLGVFCGDRFSRQ